MAQSIPQLYEPHSAAANTLPWVLHAIARTALMKRFSAKHDSALQSDPTQPRSWGLHTRRRFPILKGSIIRDNLS